jgi:hypothetical protein
MATEYTAVRNKATEQQEKDPCDAHSVLDIIAAVDGPTGTGPTL